MVCVAKRASSANTHCKLYRWLYPNVHVSFCLKLAAGTGRLVQDYKMSIFIGILIIREKLEPFCAPPFTMQSSLFAYRAFHSSHLKTSLSNVPAHKVILMSLHLDNKKLTLLGSVLVLERLSTS